MRYQLEVALNAPGALLLLVGCAIAAGLLFLPLSRLLGLNPGWTLLALLSLAPILTFTMPDGGSGLQSGAAEGRVLHYLGSFLHPSAPGAGLNAAGSEDERIANLLLFIPAALFGTLATRRGSVTALACVALSFGIECWQAASGVRVATLTDWLYNSGGALTGAMAGAMVLAAARWAAQRPGHAPATDVAADSETTLALHLVGGRADRRRVAW